MKLLESIIQGGISTSEQYASVSATAKSAADTLRTNGTNRLDDIVPVPHSPSNGPVSDVLREATRAASQLLPADAGELPGSNMAPLDKAGVTVQRAVNAAATGNAHNLAFALKMQSDARADAISNVSAGIGNLSPTVPKSHVGGSRLGGAAASSDLTPSQVDAIVINTLEDLKTFYAQYAKDYAAVQAYIAQYKSSDPTDCAEQLEDFAQKYGKPVYIGAGIDPAYVSLSLGDTFVVSDASLPQKGDYETYSINSALLSEIEKRAKFIEQLHTDATDAHAIWGTVTGAAPVTLDQAEAAVDELDAASANTYQVSEKPPVDLQFYTVTQNADGSYTVKPSQDFLDAIKAFRVYLAKWNETGNPPDESTDEGVAAEKYAGAWVAQWGAPAGGQPEQQWVDVIQNAAIVDFDALPIDDPDKVSAEIDSLIRSDAAKYGGLKTVISSAKAGITDPYGSLVQEYMQYVQSITDLEASLSNYVKASESGTTVTFEAADLKSAIDTQIAKFQNWSLTLPATSALSASDWQKELGGNFTVTKNETDGTTLISLDLTNLQAMSSSLSGYKDGDISVTQYNAWYAGFTGQKDGVMNLSQSIAEKFSRMNSTFDNLVRLMSSTISALLESEEKYFQF